MMSTILSFLGEITFLLTKAALHALFIITCVVTIIFVIYKIIIYVNKILKILTKHIRILYAPNHAPVKLIGRSIKEKQIILQFKKPSTAVKYITDTPVINLTGMEGLAWLSREGYREAEDKLQEILTQSTYGEIEGELQDRNELLKKIIELTGPLKLGKE